MKSLPKLLAALVVASAALTAVPALTGCYASGGALVIDDVPPPPLPEVVVYRPGYIWIQGRWTYPRDHWVWRGGYYEPVRPNAVYVDGRWERRGRGHVWIEGGWRPRRGVVLRERR